MKFRYEFEIKKITNDLNQTEDKLRTALMSYEALKKDIENKKKLLEQLENPEIKPNPTPTINTVTNSPLNKPTMMKTGTLDENRIKAFEEKKNEEKKKENNEKKASNKSKKNVNTKISKKDDKLKTDEAKSTKVENTQSNLPTINNNNNSKPKQKYILKPPNV